MVFQDVSRTDGPVRDQINDLERTFNGSTTLRLTLTIYCVVFVLVVDPKLCG